MDGYNDRHVFMGDFDCRCDGRTDGHDTVPIDRDV